MFGSEGDEGPCQICGSEGNYEPTPLQWTDDSPAKVLLHEIVQTSDLNCFTKSLCAKAPHSRVCESAVPDFVGYGLVSCRSHLWRCSHHDLSVTRLLC